MRTGFKNICIVMVTAWLAGCGSSTIVIRKANFNDLSSGSENKFTLLFGEFKDYRVNPNYIGRINGFSLPITLKKLKLYDGRALSRTFSIILNDTMTKSGFNVLEENDNINKLETNKYDFLVTGGIDSFDLFEQRGFVGSRHAVCDLKISLKFTNPKNGKIWSTYYSKHDDLRYKSVQEVANLAIASVLKDFHQDLIDNVYLYDLR